MKIFVVLDTNLFRNLRINIFIYYFVSVTAFLAYFYYFLAIIGIDNFYMIILFLFVSISVSGIFISKLAIDPLIEYAINLQNLSKETLHELNLPISTIKTNTQMLSKNLHDNKSIKRIERINNACDMLQDRYNELDYMIKMQSREDVKEEFFVDELVQERVSFLSKIYPTFEFNTNLETLQILNDRKGLTKVIDNIIDNGVKYSKDSKIIDIKLHDNSLFIQDYGIGMDEAELLKIFDNYYQSNNNMKGFGIGLSMVKRHCDKNDTILRFKSSPDNGTRVELKFKKI